MTLADAFHAAAQDAVLSWDATSPLAGRLATACAMVLPVAGAGVTVFSASGIRMSLGVSNDAVTQAERVEFTLGDGPCLHAYRTAAPVSATAGELADRWPVFCRRLVGRTAFRSVRSTPFPSGIAGLGTLDLYCARDTDLLSVNHHDLDDIAGQITMILLSGGVVPLTAQGERFLSSPPITSRNWVFVASDQLQAMLGITDDQAVEALRQNAVASHRNIDDVACDLVTGRLEVTSLTAIGNRPQVLG